MRGHHYYPRLIQRMKWHRCNGAGVTAVPNALKAITTTTTTRVNEMEAKRVYGTIVSKAPSLSATSRREMRAMSDVFSGGEDLLAESSTVGRRKVVLDGYAPTGFDVLGMLDEEDEAIHMNGSLLALPHSCFLWNVPTPQDLTLESLSLVLLLRPTPRFLFLGSDSPFPPPEFRRIQTALKRKHIIVEHQTLMNAMGTFNIMNAEDRRVAVGLIMSSEKNE